MKLVANVDRLPVLVSHKYWHRRMQFMLASDTSESTCIIVPAYGAFEYQIGERHGMASRGEMVLCPPNIVFHRKAAKVPLSFHTFFLQWTGPDGTVESTFNHIPYGSLLLKNEHRLRENLAALSIEREDSQWIQHRQKQHILTDLWFQYGHGMENHTSNPMEYADPLLTQIEEKLQQYLECPFMLKDLAKEVSLTPVQLTRRFHAKHSQTPMEYLISVKLKNACRLLTDTHMSLDDIAMECGYETGYSLSRAFFKHMRVRPSDYRKWYQI